LEERENGFTTIDAGLKYGNNVVQMLFEGEDISDLGTPTDSQFLETMEALIEDQNDGSVLESGIDKYVINNRSAPYAIGIYTTEGLFGNSFNVALLVTSVHVTDDEVVLVRYVAEQDDFDKYLPKAKQVINSISLVNSTQADKTTFT
jgi:hypothetical protein